MLRIQRHFELNGAVRSFASWHQPRLRMYVIRTRGVVFDTRIQSPPRLPSTGPSRSQLVVVLEGEYLWRHRGREHTIRQGDALIAPLTDWDERWEGRQFRLLIVEGYPESPRQAASVQLGRLDAGGLRRALQVADALEAGAPPEPLWSRWLDVAEAQGVALVREEVTPPEEAVRVHQALSRILTRKTLNPTWVDLENELGITERTMRRWLTHHAAWFTRLPDFKAQIVYWKLSSAAMLLSAPGNRVHQVAQAVGYGSDRALLRAMQDYGLPPPREIRRAFSLTE